jgi:hypothetical protein
MEWSFGLVVGEVKIQSQHAEKHRQICSFIEHFLACKNLCKKESWDVSK